MLKIGIDPGLSGAIAFLDENDNLVEVRDMPVMKLSKSKNQVNAAGLVDLIKQTGGDVAYVERVGAMPGQGVSSMFNFGKTAGVIEGVLAALGIPVNYVAPRSWKSRAGLLGQDKDMARTKAIQLYPAAPLHRKKDIGRADAILIARHGKK